MMWTGKMTVGIVLGFILLVIGVVGVLYYAKVPIPPVVACTQEAMQCPDGSYVGRTGPNCSFAACPVATSSSQSNGGLQGTMTIGPICPVEQAGHPCKPTPAMFAAHPVFVYSSDKSALIETLTPDANGNFSITLPTGTYLIDVQHQSIGATRGVPTLLTITQNATSTLTINIDTGIR